MQHAIEKRNAVALHELLLYTDGESIKYPSYRKITLRSGNLTVMSP